MHFAEFLFVDAMMFHGFAGNEAALFGVFAAAKTELVVRAGGIGLEEGRAPVPCCGV